MVKMTDSKLDELKRLSPEERLKKLKEFEDQRKKDLEETQKMIKSSMEEARREKAVEDVDIPDSEPVNIDKLFDSDEENLESAVHAEHQAFDNADGENLSYQLKQDFEELKNLSYKELDQYEVGKLEEIEDRLGKVSYENASKDMAQQLVTSKGIVYNIKKYGGLLD